jgi:glycosidase
MMHDSTIQTYRDPVGAVTQGLPLTLRFKTRLSQVGSVYLCLTGDGYHEDIMMAPDNGFWRTDITAPSMPGVYWYYFKVNTGEKIVYYGTEGKRKGGIGCAYTETPPSYQLTVYNKDFDTPSWFRKSVMYQIFPDRFKRSGEDTVNAGLDYHRKKGRLVHEHKRWNEEPLYKPLPGEEHYNPCDYYGGTLKGIEESLDYLKSLGVGVIYLNPIFESASNHRYNTADYRNVDPVLGSEEDFSSLFEKAESLGIRIMLDGVFSHTGSDSIYFNREKAYDSVGAANSQESPYYPWYTFEHYPDKYKSWWGFESLPEVNEHNPDWQLFVITDEDSILRHWIRLGCCGYRLDVADELPDEVLALMYEAAKRQKNDAVMLGEVWEDATTKYSYGTHRKYALGGMLDSVMNYPLRNAIVSFLTGQINARELRSFLVDQATAYPKPMYYALMNLLSSHDIERVRTALSTHIDPHSLNREQQASFRLSDSQNKRGAMRQRLASVLQFALPGVPCIYYGDETGMTGFLDPFNRGPFQKAAHELTAHYQRISALRTGADALTTGYAAFLSPDEDCIGILRYVLDSKDAFGSEAQNGIYFIAVNRSQEDKHVVFDFAGHVSLMTQEQQNQLRSMLVGEAVCQLTNERYQLNDGLLEINMPGGEAVWLKIQ